MEHHIRDRANAEVEFNLKFRRIFGSYSKSRKVSFETHVLQVTRSQRSLAKARKAGGVRKNRNEESGGGEGGGKRRQEPDRTVSTAREDKAREGRTRDKDYKDRRRN